MKIISRDCLLVASTAADNSLTYNQACTIGSSQCMSSQGLTCANGFCSCTSPYSWNTGSKTCKNLFLINEKEVKHSSRQLVNIPTNLLNIKSMLFIIRIELYKSNLSM